MFVVLYVDVHLDVSLQVLKKRQAVVKEDIRVSGFILGGAISFVVVVLLIGLCTN